MILLDMEQKVAVNNNGIDSAGLTSDYMEAIAEFIWNGFDEAASSVSINFESNNLDYITSVSVTDNGNGIDLSNIDNTFGNFMDSVKKVSYQKSSSNLRGNKGKGRFSFIAFSGVATWQTTFFDGVSKHYLDYEITIKKNSKDKFNIENKAVSKRKTTGTTVKFSELSNVTGYSFSSEEFREFLAREFGWFLLLNKDKGYKIEINSEFIGYDQLIADNEVKEIFIESEGSTYNFKATFVRWKEKIGEKFYFYFLNSNQTEIGKELTSFNNNAIGFNHSVYVESKYFDSFTLNDKEQTLPLFGSTKSSSVFKVLMSSLQQFVKEKQKDFVNGVAAQKLIDTYERTGVIPAFKNNKYDQARRKDLIDVVTGIYCIEPKIFQGLNKEQQKISIGLINVLLDTDERTTIIELIGEIVSLSSEEREGLLNILKKTTIAKIAKTINIIESRFKTIGLIKMLVFDLKKFTSEIHHLQQAIENNFWLFGEQYHLVSANESFSVLQKRYLALIEQLEAEDKRKLRTKFVKKGQLQDTFNRRPDIFLVRTHTIPDVSDDQYLLEENLLVELKRPSVTIGKEQLRQIEDYLEIIRTDDKFNSQKRLWKFIIIGNQIDEYVLGQYQSQKEKGKRFLVKSIYNYEIYAYTWDDIFLMFDLRHKFIVDNLDFDKDAIKRELLEKGINLQNLAPDTVSAEIERSRP